MGSRDAEQRRRSSAPYAVTLKYLMCVLAATQITAVSSTRNQGQHERQNNDHGPQDQSPTGYFDRQLSPQQNQKNSATDLTNKKFAALSGMYNASGDIIYGNDDKDYFHYDNEARDADKDDVGVIFDVHRRDDKSRGVADEDMSSDSIEDTPDDEGVFNVSAAVVAGARAQYDMCNMYCDENSSDPVWPPDCHHEQLTCGTRPCHCDLACSLYGDCCPSQDGASSPHIGDMPHLCVEVSLGQWTDFVHVIAGCPVNSGGSQEAVKACRACRQDQAVRQLAVSLDTHAIYCNTHCAVCHGDTNVTVMTDTDCQTTPEPATDVITYTLLPNNGTRATARTRPADLPQPSQTPTPLTSTPHGVTRCHPYLATEHQAFRRDMCTREPRTRERPVSTCNATRATELNDYDAMEALCQLYSFPVRGSGTVYRNLFCALCNGVVPRQRVCMETSFISFTSGDIGKLTSLDEVWYIHPTVKPSTCVDEKQWYDVVVDMCRPVKCARGRLWSRGQTFCRDPTVKNVTTVYMYHLNMTFTPHSFQSQPLFRCLPQWSEVQSALVHHLAEAVLRLNVTSYALDTACSDDPTKVSVCVEFVVVHDDDHIDFELKILEVFTAVPDLVLNKDNNGSSLSFDASLQTVDDGWIERDPFVPFSNKSCCFKKEGSFSLFSHYVLDKDAPFPVIAVAFNPLTPYAQVLLNASEYTLDEDKMFTLTYTNTTLDPLQVREISYGLFVSLGLLREMYVEAGLVPDSVKTVRVLYTDTGALQLVSMLCLVVSVISLLFLLTTYSTFRELRTLPGINTMFLAGWLLMAQVLLLVVPDRMEPAPVCQALGVVLHYSWLCVVSWCSVCSYHMFHVFVGQRDGAREAHGHTWYFRRYVTLAHVVPALIVLLVILGVSVSSGARDVGYGGRVCYLNSVLLVGLGFVLPLSLTVLLNAVLLVLTARAVSHVDQLQRYGVQAPERNNVRVYAGLSSLTGLCWVVALLAEIPGCGWLRYLSAVLNGLQGLHLALSYAANKRVIKMWRQKMASGRCKFSLQLSTTTQTSSTAGNGPRTVSSYV